MSFRNTVEFEVSGAYALFSDPIMRVGGEKTSLHAPTYEALKGILSSVYWKPVLTWVIDAVRIMNPIQTEVNEMSEFVQQCFHKRNPVVQINHGFAFIGLAHSHAQYRSIGSVKSANFRCHALPFVFGGNFAHKKRRQL